MTKPHHAPSTGVKRINLALQGGGSHGAFAWGVIDRLLSDDRIYIEAVSGASAGAMNAVVLAEGLGTGNREHARKTLREFWEGVGSAAALSPIRRTPFDQMIGSWSVDSSPVFMWLDLLSRLASPYEINPLNFDPLRELLDRLVDFDQVRGCGHLKVFISATNVETGRAKIFHRDELTIDHVLASACLPLLHQAVVIDGKPYWDGGFTGNPPLWPLFDYSTTDDVLLVQINPLCRHGVPRHARDIINRLNEITFNTPLLHELRAINFVSRLIDAGRLEGTGYRQVLIHAISGEPTLKPIGSSSKLNAEQDFLDMLFEAGSTAAQKWLRRHFDDLGVRSTLDVASVLEGDEDALNGDRLDRRAFAETDSLLRETKLTANAEGQSS